MDVKKQKESNFFKTVEARVDSTGTIENLYECFNKHKNHLLDDAIAGLFLSRLRFFKNKSLSTYEKDKCEELQMDIEVERDIHCNATTKAIGSSTLTITFDISNGSIYSDCIVAIVKLAIDKFGGQRSAISTFLGIPDTTLSDLFYRNKELRSYWDDVRRRNKRIDE